MSYRNPLIIDDKSDIAGAQDITNVGNTFASIINTKNETLEKFQITPDIIDTYFIDPLEFKQHNSPIPNNMNNDYVIE
jgi:hypothetical protein